MGEVLIKNNSNTCISSKHLKSIWKRIPYTAIEAIRYTAQRQKEHQCWADRVSKRGQKFCN